MRNEKRLSVGADLINDAIVFPQDEVELGVVVLEFLFLKKNNLGGLRNINSNSGKALSFTDKSEDFRVKVDVKTVVIGVANDKGSLEASLCLLDLKGPLLPPEVLVREEGVTDLVVLFDWAFVVALLGEFWGELFHGHGDAVEEVTGPSDAA